MRFPLKLNISLTRYIIKNKIAGKSRFPLVLMLEPTHLCNLYCEGCGRIREYQDTLNNMMTLEECINAVDESGAPVVSICGGEPLLYPWIVELVNAILDRKKHIFLCTNGLNLDAYLEKFKPSPYFNINLSIDGMADTHDAIRGRKGVYDNVITIIGKSKKMGFRVVTNTTVYKNTSLDELSLLFKQLDNLKVDGILVSPAYNYDSVKGDLFLDRTEIYRKFKGVGDLSEKYRFFSTPLYLKFLRGERKLSCTPWGNITVNPRGWKGPCYLITDTHYKTFEELMENTNWEKYEQMNDTRCKNCMVHSGFEPSVVFEVCKNMSDLLEMIKWNLS